MVYKLVKELDAVKRINIPNELLNIVGLNTRVKIAFCQHDEGIAIRRHDDIQNCKVIGVAWMDEKKRICIPKYIRENTTKYEVYIFNGELILKEAE